VGEHEQRRCLARSVEVDPAVLDLESHTSREPHERVCGSATRENLLISPKDSRANMSYLPCRVVLVEGTTEVAAAAIEGAVDADFVARGPAF
jgi:hypothetical protein